MNTACGLCPRSCDRETRFRGRWGLSAQAGSRGRPTIQQWQCHPQIQPALLTSRCADVAQCADRLAGPEGSGSIAYVIEKNELPRRQLGGTTGASAFLKTLDFHSGNFGPIAV